MKKVKRKEALSKTAELMDWMGRKEPEMWNEYAGSLGRAIESLKKEKTYREEIRDLKKRLKEAEGRL